VEEQNGPKQVACLLHDDDDYTITRLECEMAYRGVISFLFVSGQKILGTNCNFFFSFDRLDITLHCVAVALLHTGVADTQASSHSMLFAWRAKCEWEQQS